MNHQQNQQQNDPLCSEQFIGGQCPLRLLVVVNSQCPPQQQQQVKIKKLDLQLEIRGAAVDVRLAEENRGRPYQESCIPTPKQVLQKSMQKIVEQFGGQIFYTNPIDLTCQMVRYLRNWLQGKPVNLAVKQITIIDDEKTHFTTAWPPTISTTAFSTDIGTFAAEQLSREQQQTSADAFQAFRTFL